MAYICKIKTHSSLLKPGSTILQGKYWKVQTKTGAFLQADATVPPEQIFYWFEGFFVLKLKYSVYRTTQLPLTFIAVPKRVAKHRVG